MDRGGRGRDWLRSISERCGWEGGKGGVEGSVTDSHLVPVARAARVVPLSAVAFDGLSCFPPILVTIFKSEQY